MIRLRLPASMLATFMEPKEISAIATAMTARARECPTERIDCALFDAAGGVCSGSRPGATDCGEPAS